MGDISTIDSSRTRTHFGTLASALTFSGLIFAGGMLVLSIVLMFTTIFGVFCPLQWLNDQFKGEKGFEWLTDFIATIRSNGFFDIAIYPVIGVLILILAFLVHHFIYTTSDDDRNHIVSGFFFFLISIIGLNPLTMIGSLVYMLSFSSANKQAKIEKLSKKEVDFSVPAPTIQRVLAEWISIIWGVIALLILGVTCYYAICFFFVNKGNDNIPLLSSSTTLILSSTGVAAILTATTFKGGIAKLWDTLDNNGKGLPHWLIGDNNQANNLMIIILILAAIMFIIAVIFIIVIYKAVRDNKPHGWTLFFGIITFPLTFLFDLVAAILVYVGRHKNVSNELIPELDINMPKEQEPLPETPAEEEPLPDAFVPLDKPTDDNELTAPIMPADADNELMAPLPQPENIDNEPFAVEKEIKSDLANPENNNPIVIGSGGGSGGGGDGGDHHHGHITINNTQNQHPGHAPIYPNQPINPPPPIPYPMPQSIAQSAINDDIFDDTGLENIEDEDPTKVKTKKKKAKAPAFIDISEDGSSEEIFDEELVSADEDIFGESIKDDYDIENSDPFLKANGDNKKPGAPSANAGKNLGGSKMFKYGVEDMSSARVVGTRKGIVSAVKLTSAGPVDVAPVHQPMPQQPMYIPQPIVINSSSPNPMPSQPVIITPSTSAEKKNNKNTNNYSKKTYEDLIPPDEIITIEKDVEDSGNKKVSKIVTNKTAIAFKAHRHFNPLLLPDDKLSPIVGHDPITAADALKQVWAYIRQANLQDKRNILLDDKLELIVDDDNLDKIDMTQLPKYIHSHLLREHTVIGDGDTEVIDITPEKPVITSKPKATNTSVPAYIKVPPVKTKIVKVNNKRDEDEEEPIKPKKVKAPVETVKVKPSAKSSSLDLKKVKPVTATKKKVKEQEEDEEAIDLAKVKVAKTVSKNSKRKSNGDEDLEDLEPVINEIDFKSHKQFNPIVLPAPEIRPIVGSKVIHRSDAIKLLWKYIKKEDYQDPKNKRIILVKGYLKNFIPDAKSVSMFEILKYFNKYLLTQGKISI